MPSSKLSRELVAALRAHRAAFTDVARRRSSLLELSAMMLAVQHYERIGYVAFPQNLNRGQFKAKWSAKGDPRAYSWWQVTRHETSFEIHLNAAVWDGRGGKDATFVVDVGVVIYAAFSRKDSEKPDLTGFENADLRTFIESKSLPIYPMLVAQFLGITAEILPWSRIGAVPPQFEQQGHFDPALVSRGQPSANTERLLDKLARDGLRIRIVPSFDMYVEGGRLTQSTGASVLARELGRIWPGQT